MNKVLTKLNNIIEQKQTRLSVSADVVTADELIALTEATADNICVLKTHIDIIRDFTPSLIIKLRELADKHNFLIFEDRKFADIGNTVKNQFKEGVYKISSWADIINAHIIPGSGIIDGLRSGLVRDTGLLLLAQMSSKGNFFTKEYTQSTVKLAQDNKDFVMGFIAQEKLCDDADLITMTPGVQLSKGGDNLGQQYNTPQYVLSEKKSDIIIVGRAIYGSENPREASKAFKEESWKY